MKDDPRILLNFSMLGGGTICDIIACLFDRKSISNYMIDTGGEMTVKGKNPQGWNWCIGVVRSEDDSIGANSELEQIVQLSKRLGLATSGSYRNFYLKDERKYAHVINPITGYPVQKDILSAITIAHQCMLADVYATAFMTLRSRKVRQLQKEHPEIDNFIIYTDSCGNYRTEYSPRMKRYLAD